MKFRCEREILADALTTAGRAATSRSGTLPVLSGVRLDVKDGELTVTGTDLELTIRLTVEVGGVVFDHFQGLSSYRGHFRCGAASFQ